MSGPMNSNSTVPPVAVTPMARGEYRADSSDFGAAHLPAVSASTAGSAGPIKPALSTPVLAHHGIDRASLPVDALVGDVIAHMAALRGIRRDVTEGR